MATSPPLAELRSRHAPAIVHEAPGVVFATWRNVFIGVWGTPGTLALAHRLDEAMSAFDAAHPEGFSSLHFIVNGVGLPDAAARAALRRVAERHARSVACVGTVIDGGGFWASAIRSFFTSLTVFSRKPYKALYVSTVGELARWVPPVHSEQTGVRIAAAELEQALLAARDRLRPAP